MTGFLESAGVYVQSIDDVPLSLLRNRSHTRYGLASPTPLNELELPEPWRMSWDTAPHVKPRCARSKPAPAEVVDPYASQTDLDMSTHGHIQGWHVLANPPERSRRTARQPETVYYNATAEPGTDIPPGSGGWIASLGADCWRVPSRKAYRLTEPVQAMRAVEPEILINPSPADAPRFIRRRPPNAEAVNYPDEPQVIEVFLLASWPGQFRPPQLAPKPMRASMEFPVAEWEYAPQQLWLYSQTFGHPRRAIVSSSDTAAVDAISQFAAAGGTANPGSFEHSLAENGQLAWFTQQVPAWIRKTTRRAPESGASGMVLVQLTSSFTVSGPYVVTAMQVSWLGAIAGSCHQ